jgi:isopenicillin N synthase-like dioxygenase
LQPHATEAGLNATLSALATHVYPLANEIEPNVSGASSSSTRSLASPVVSFDDCRAWFARSSEEKLHYALKNGKGYQKLGQNITENRMDAHEAIDFYRPSRVSVPGTLLGPHPDVGDECLLRSVNARAKALTRLGKKVMRCIARGLNMSDDAFEDDIAGVPFWIMRLISSPAMTSDDEGEYKISCGAHVDYGLLTFLDASMGGLQIEIKRGEWIDVPYMPGTLVCNIGEMLARCTSYQFKATKHRVIRRREHGDDARISIAFFYEPNYDAEIKPLVENSYTNNLSADECAALRTVTVYADFLNSKVASNFVAGDK